MLSPGLPINELQRQSALNALGLLDTPPESRFDRLVGLAKVFFDVPYALITLIDGDRQWFKSRIGIGVEETPRNVSFCGHAILNDEILHVPDARLDARFVENPMVIGPPQMRFYAGAPLHTVEGYRIGTLCIVDDQPRELLDEQLRTLRELADCIEHEINARSKANQNETALESSPADNQVVRSRFPKAQFIATMSHQLRTLLNVVIALSEMMKVQMYGPMNNEKYKDYSSDIHSAGQHMLSIINDILDLSKIESASSVLHDRPVNVRENVEACLAMVRSQAIQKQQKLRTDVPDGLPQLICDQRYLRQMMINLLSNAIKFTPTSGEIVCRAFLTNRNELEIQIEDTGIGISEDDLKFICEPFTRARTKDDALTEGTGLGLSIVEGMMRLHGGNIRLSSDVGIGTIVTLSFPTERLNLNVA